MSGKLYFDDYYSIYLVSMGQYKYSKNGSAQGEGPYIHVVVKNIIASQVRTFDCMALLDTGSDVTIFPVRELERIGLKSLGKDKVIEGTSLVRVRPFVASMDLDGKYLPRMPILGWGHQYSIIGRDVLNKWRVDFHGPQLFFDIV